MRDSGLLRQSATHYSLYVLLILLHWLDYRPPQIHAPPLLGSKAPAQRLYLIYMPPYRITLLKRSAVQTRSYNRVR